MSDTKTELTGAQKRQIAVWKELIHTYESRGQECFSRTKIEELLNEIQDFIRHGLPDHLYLNLRKVIDAIYEAFLILAEPGKDDQHYKKAGHQLYLAIKELSKEE